MQGVKTTCSGAASPKPRISIEPVGGKALGVGNVTVLGRDIVHSVVNPLDKINAAIQVYDGDFFAVRRSMWDAETLVQKPYDIGAITKGMPVVGR